MVIFQTKYFVPAVALIIYDGVFCFGGFGGLIFMNVHNAMYYGSKTLSNFFFQIVCFTLEFFFSWLK
jgi:hypothetical protein